MNKQSWIIIIILLVLLLIGVGIFFYYKNTTSHINNENNYEANRTSSNNEKIENKISSSIEITKGLTESSILEEQIATFTTKIYSNDSARQNNISITCNTLNGTIVKNGETFSFCGTVGASSTSKGYQKADIFDRYGNKKKGLGGRKLSN